MKNFINTLSAAVVTTTLLAGAAQADNYFWDYFNQGSYQKGQVFESTTLAEPVSFDAHAHLGTYFWGNFDNEILNQKKQPLQLATFDESAHQGTYFWGYFNN